MIKLKDITKGYVPNPILKDVPNKLKKPENFKKLEEKLASILDGRHRHKSIPQYAKCVECSKKRGERNKAIMDAGFKTMEQYLLYKRIMTIIINKQNIVI